VELYTAGHSRVFRPGLAGAYTALVLWPLMLAYALLVRLTSPVLRLLPQTRIGLDGPTNSRYKLPRWLMGAEVNRSTSARA